MKTKIFHGISIVATCTWKPEDNKVYVHWNYAFLQIPIDPEDIPDFLVQRIETFCKKNGLTLWSY